MRTPTGRDSHDQTIHYRARAGAHHPEDPADAGAGSARRAADSAHRGPETAVAGALRLVALGEQLDGGNVVLRRIRADSRPLAGTRLIREWQGVQHVVTVRADDFEYEGRPYRSLSAIARNITGTRWNGWTFFGLKHHRRAA